MIVRDTVIFGNTAYIAGGAVNLWGSNIVLERVLMHENGAYTAIDVWGDGQVSLLSSTLVDHPAHGVRLVQSRLTAVNSILWASAGREILFGNAPTPTSVAVVAYTDVEGGPGDVLVNDDGTLYWLEGNLDVDPQFVDPARGDYRLLPASECREAGTSHFEWGGDLFVHLESQEYCGEAPDLGAFEFCDVTGLDVARVDAIALQASPNPFNPRTTIRYSVPQSGPVTLGVFDVRGRHVQTLVEDRVFGGHEVTWDGRDDRGKELPSGTYLLRLEAGADVRTSRVSLIR